MSIHGISSSATAHARPPAAPLMWRRSRVDFTYPPLASIDPMREGLSDVPGVVVVWDGARAGADEPAGRCLYVGQTRDLAAAVGLLREDPALTAQADDLRVTWAAIGIAHRPGVVAYLRDMLGPAVTECGLDAQWPVRPDVRPVPVPLPS
ncbi:hypothetical protein C882_4510 [Caenispirillum salinarum AK4]|uniref:Uncharacterized protein n=1 Tax=Caenispirillum salinarum AK4 TaxID=1238182 RepID=K9HQ31_9PROT|nr:hypothetical protein [Caenispirillum salinarum]EKV30551.1 hypothetical protein C882_4510 [Caenispirillum salinarum AK4]